MFFGSSVYKEIITAASERLACFKAFIFPSEIGSAFVTITHTGNWGRGRRYLGSFSVRLPLESMAAQHWMWGAVSKSPCSDEREAGSIKQPSISPAAGHGGASSAPPCRCFCLWESLHAGKINLRDNTGRYCLSQVPTQASLFQEMFSWKQKPECYDTFYTEEKWLGQHGLPAARASSLLSLPGYTFH